MSEPINSSLDNCGCCEPEPTPSPIYNRPGLPALSYRSGIYATFFRRMLSRLGTLTLPDGDHGGTRPLTSLTTRSSDDPAIALLDASAVVADVLTFYQERIANEGFIRTSTERRSILEMARAIGYELNPGVAASTYLAFTLEDAPGAPESAEIPAGTKVQSIPPQGQLPQPFETSKTILARPEWNALLPRQTHPQQVTTTSQKLYLQGTATGLKKGDRLLIDSGGSQKLARILNLEVQMAQKRTLVTLDGTTPPSFTPSSLSQGQLDITMQIPLGESSINTYIRGLQWTDGELNAFLNFNQWDQKQLLKYLSSDRAANPVSSGSVHALRTMVGIFGNNAPLYASLPKNSSSVTTYPGQNWDNGWSIWKSQQTNSYYSSADIYLERVIDGLVPDSWICLDSVGDTPRIYKISSLIQYGGAAFAISGKFTGITLKTPAGALLNDNTTDKPDSFDIRETSAYLQSEELDLVELPIDEELDSDPSMLELNGLVLGLQVGQSVALIGERIDTPGVTASEILTIKTIDHIGGFTVLTFESGRQYSYKRTTVTLNANVAPATHGETVSEILGNGNGAQSNQKFTLRKTPLTHTAASTPSGSASTLQLRVNNLLWGESPSLYELEPNDQHYTVRLDDDGKPLIIFGDGVKGARLPTGVNNVVATYRSGIGLAGQVQADSLTILQSRPLGVKGVTNPLAASGAGDPETMDGARENAPLTVRTLDRIVSREDYEDFAAAFAGIGKAQAVDMWSGEYHLVHLTIAGEDGKPITNSDFLKNFMDALDEARDPTQLIKVDTLSQLLFNLKINLAVDSRYVIKDVFAQVETALAESFSFPKRGFGQGVTTAEVITITQKIAGVIFVDIESLHLSSDSEDLNQILTANIAHVENNLIQPAQLLLINTFGITLQEVQA
ncbi:MAG: putative baseplate assembly protein [Anaerolineales bacterium]|nr:putative baseplate assembly protein [Anaerolineales bacterium]